MKNNKAKVLVFAVCMIYIGLTACIHSNIFEKNTAIPSFQWKSKFQPMYEFEITDTNMNYAMFLTLRHTDAYPYSNIWLNIKTQKPNTKEFINERIEIPLAQADGKWLGRGMNEIWEHKMPLTADEKGLHFSNVGLYRIQLEQIMRTDPLPEIMSVGIRLEKNQ